MADTDQHTPDDAAGRSTLTGFYIRGVVEAAETGEGLGGFIVVILDEDKRPVKNLGPALTDTHGRFEIRYRGERGLEPAMFAQVYTPGMAAVTEIRIPTSGGHAEPVRIQVTGLQSPGQNEQRISPEEEIYLACGKFAAMGDDYPDLKHLFVLDPIRALDDAGIELSRRARKLVRRRWPDLAYESAELYEAAKHDAARRSRLTGVRLGTPSRRFFADGEGEIPDARKDRER